jgi:phage-related protein
MATVGLVETGGAILSVWPRVCLPDLEESVPPINVHFYEERDHSVPVRDWLDGLPEKARDKFLAAMHLLEEFGYELDRPYAAYLGDDLYELRVKFYRVNYRILYFFHDRTATILCHGLAKEKQVPKKDIRTAAERMARFNADPDRHTFHPRE